MFEIDRLVLKAVHLYTLSVSQPSHLITCPTGLVASIRAEADATQAKLISEKTLLHQQLVDMDSTLASERLKIETLSAEAAEAVTSREALMAEKTLLHQQLVDMDSTLASERLKIETLSAEAADGLDQAQEEISALQCMLAQTQDKVSQLETQLLDTQLQAETSRSGLNDY